MNLIRKKYFLLCLTILLSFSFLSCESIKIKKEIGVTPNTQNLKKHTHIVFQFDITDQVYKEEKWKVYKDPREQQMTELFETYLIKYGKTIVDRSKINQLLKEMNFSQTGFSIEDGKRVGKIANADVIIFGTISRLSWWTDTKTILVITSIKAIHVETGVLLWKGDLDGTVNYAGSPTQGEGEVQELSRRLFEELLKNAII